MNSVDLSGKTVQRYFGGRSENTEFPTGHLRVFVRKDHLMFRASAKRV